MSAIELDELNKYCKKIITTWRKNLKKKVSENASDYQKGWARGYLSAHEDLLEKIKSPQEQAP